MVRMEVGLRMKAIVTESYGSPDVLELKEVAQPAPKADEVLIRVHAASVNAADWHMLRADPFLVRFGSGLRKPNFTILGGDIAGVVEAAGSSVTQFKVGDAVYGEIAGSGWGGYAEYVCAPEKVLAPKPTNLTFEQAAAVPMAGLTAVQALRDQGKVQPGTEGPDPGRLRGRGHLCRPDRQGAGRRGDGRLQHPQRREDERTGCGPRDRLHA